MGNQFSPVTGMKSGGRNHSGVKFNGQAWRELLQHFSQFFQLYKPRNSNIILTSTTTTSTKRNYSELKVPRKEP